MNIKILILGSNGFFGKNLKKLLKFENNNTELLFIEKKDINILDKNQISSFFKIHQPNVVINCCGIVGSSELNKNNNQLSILNDNLILNINIMECCHLYNVSKLILFSTYRLLNENNINFNYNEEDINKYFYFNPNNKNIGYLLSKNIMDMQIQLYNKYYNTSIVCFILPNIFGPEDNFYVNGRIIPSLLCKFKIASVNNVDIFINGNSSNTVNLIYINDLINIIEKSIFNPHIKGNILVCNPNGTIDLYELTKTIKKITNFKNNIIFENQENITNNNIFADLSKFNKFYPNFMFTDIITSLTETITHFNVI
jgi:GDP-L-fucose synthase